MKETKHFENYSIRNTVFSNEEEGRHTERRSKEETKRKKEQQK
jgi:hypothetical protein